MALFIPVILLSGCGGGSSGGGGSPAASSAEKSTGLNGSLARITVVNDYLYLLAGSTLKTVSIVDHVHPVHTNAVELSPDIETLFPHKEALFVGGQTGVQIIDISMPDDPRLLATYQHDWQCDPVVVNGNIAYVTLRTGTRCWTGINQLDILDVSDLKAPTLIESYPLDNPHGLAIDGTTLFVADGFSGLRVFKAEDPLNLTQIAHFPGKLAQDIVLSEGRAHIIGKNGLYQYDYTVLENITFLSHVPVMGVLNDI